MSGSLEDPMRCEVIRDDLSEMAFGVLSGRRRSEGLRHVGFCSRWSAELEQLSSRADALLLLAPPVEPPVGFELRLAERLRATAARRPRRLRRLGALCAAAVAVTTLGFGLGAVVTAGAGHSEHPSATASVTTAEIFMTITGGATAPGLVTCDVTLRGGKIKTLGAFKLTGEYAAWGAPLWSATGQLRSAQLIASNGTILATARISA